MANEQLKTLEDKFSYAYDTKIAIHDAIVAKGVDIPEGTVFRDYASKIWEIETGDNTLPTEVNSFYYKTTVGYVYVYDKINGRENAAFIRTGNFYKIVKGSTGNAVIEPFSNQNGYLVSNLTSSTDIVISAGGGNS